MNIESEERHQTPIADCQTSKSRLSEPASVRLPSVQRENVVVSAVSLPVLPLEPVLPSASSRTAVPELITDVSTEASPPTEKSVGTSKAAKPKLEIETFEQFIEYAYKRRGHPVKLGVKVQKAIAKKPDLDEAAKGRLQALIDGDTLLVVPRQILLASKKATGFPRLRSALEDVVRIIMLHHPAFAQKDVAAAINNLPEAQQPAEVLAFVASYTPVKMEGGSSLKPVDLKGMRQNITHLLAVWFSLHRSIGLDEMSNLLFRALWEPAERELEDDTERLRALTDIEELAGVGVAAQRYARQVDVVQRERDQARDQTFVLARQVTHLKAQRDLLHDELNERTTELEALRNSSVKELAALRQANNVDRMQQGHEFESLRGRLARCLEECIGELDTGLSALLKEAQTSRVSVMVQRAERVLDVLRNELGNLKEV